VSVLLSSQQEAVACAEYSEGKSLLGRAVVCEWQKSRMLQLGYRENVKFCQMLGKYASKTFQTIKLVYDEEALGCGAVFKGTNILQRGETICMMMSILVSQERSEFNSRSKKLQHW
jgi:uncharacterized Fe-S cluster-containing radical SAM superfamily enzyme